MRPEQSGNIFALAEEFGIPLSLGAQEPFEDSAYLSFKSRYMEWAERRDSALTRYLVNNPNRFRVHLPYNERVLRLASQVVWFYDELIIRDPVAVLLTSPSNELESQKIKLRNLLQGLSLFRSSIEQGYLLFNSSLFAFQNDEPTEAAKLLQNNPSIQDALKKAAYFGYTERPDSNGNPMGVFQMDLDSGTVLGSNNLAGSGQSPEIIIGEKLPPIEPQRLAAILNDDPFKMLQLLYPGEIQRSIISLEHARQIGAAALFDREADSVILSHAALVSDVNKQNLSVRVLNLTLPYLRGVVPERLQDLREESPTAFEDFRGRLSEIVSQAVNEGINTPEELKAKIDREVLPQIRSLESEASAAVKKNKILSLGSAVATATGILAGTYLGVMPAILLGMGATGSAAIIKSLSEYSEAQEKNKAHPFYFLWRAKS
jgi:hypothetical protein